MIGALILIGCGLAVLLAAIAADTLIAWGVRKWRARSMIKAIREVSLGRAERIASPGQWKVWRGPDGRTLFENSDGA